MIRMVELVFHIMVTISMPVPTGTQSIDRAAQLLVMVVESEEPVSIGELAERTELPKSTVSRLVSALERQALVQRASSRGPLRAGPVLMRLAHRGVSDRDLVELCEPTLARLAEISGETINLGVPTSLGVEHLAQVDSSHFIGATNWLGRRVALHTNALGKVFLAFGAARLGRGSLERLTPATVTDRAVLDSQLQQIRAEGFAIVVDELEPNLAAVAAPVRDAGGAVVAALSISGPDHRLPRPRLRELGGIIVHEADLLSTRLGHEGTTQGAA
jgi:IclR family transcriptional regulator, acetate operon repressor